MSRLTPPLDTADWRILIDLPHKYPVLGFKEQAQALERIITNSQPRFAIGIFGAWGSGKTTLMNAIRQRLSPEKVIVADFCAWRYEREDHILVPLLDTLRQAMEDWTVVYTAVEPSVKERVLRAAKLIGLVATALVAGTSAKVRLPGLQASFDSSKALTKAKEVGDASAAEERAPIEATLMAPDGPRSLYHKSFIALKDTFTELLEHAPDLRFVVFVDDLDRCLPKSMVDSLEAIKLFFDLNGFIFVVGVDRDVVQDAISSRYAGQSGNKAYTRGADYLKKIFQVPFNLPAIRRFHLGQLLSSFEEDAKFPASQVQILTGAVKTHLEFAMTDLAINPRAVKRFINDFSIQMMVKPDLNPDIVLTLATLDTRADWRPVYEALAAEDVGFRDHLKLVIEGVSTDKDADPEYPTITPDLRAYLSGPGHPLLTSDDISVYLSSSAVVSDEPGWDPLARELAKHVARFRYTAKMAAEASDESIKEVVMDLLGVAATTLRLPQYPGSGALTDQINALAGTTQDNLTPTKCRSITKDALALGERLKQFLQMTRRSVSTPSRPSIE